MPNHLTRAYRTLTHIRFKKSILAFLPLSGSWGVILALAFLPLSECWAVEPTLARLSFWVPPERMGEFEAAYQKQVVPILKRHGLVASSELTRATVDSVFARLFEFKTAAEFVDIRGALLSDPAFQEIRRTLERPSARPILLV